MSAESNSVMQVSLTTAMSPNLYCADEPMARKPERAQASFVDTIVGRRGGLRSILSQLKAVAPTNATVLITGESGTGKAVIAQALHELSTRRTKNLVKVNCAAMPAGLLDSELFGHVRGAFTGAITSHTGRFTLADGGTLFLDEIADMPLELQPKLLRVLQDREFEAVGSARTTRVDVRVIAATSGDLWQMVQDRKFREELYYRLNSFPVNLPPLRERKEDIPAFVKYFVEQFASSMGKVIETIPEETMRAIVSHSWPGNVRELQNYVERGVILSKGVVFRPEPPRERQTPLLKSTNPTLEDTIREEVRAACQRANWKLSGPRGAAARLGLKRTTLFYMMKRLGIRRPCDPEQN
jgi:formate hydrogenlyase transcriptional activator